MTHIACCWRSGEIDIIASSAVIPDGIIAFARGPRERLETIIAARARHSYNADLYLVPGVPEAANGDAGLAALQAWVGWAFDDSSELIFGTTSQHPAIIAAAQIRHRLAAHECPRTILQSLVDDHGFAWTHDRDPQVLRGHRVTASCTAGPHGLLTNWCAGVDRKHQSTS